MCLSATTTRTWRWNILSQVRLISKPRFYHLEGCRIGLAETVNESEWIRSDRHTDRPSELIYRICQACMGDLCPNNNGVVGIVVWFSTQ